MYLVPCECESKYTGQTKKRVLSRNKEHEKNVFLQNKGDSALAVHSTICNSNIQWSETKTLAIETNYFRRCVRESLEIKRNKTGPTDRYGINQDNGLYVKTNTWDSLLNQQKISDSHQLTGDTTALSTSVEKTIALTMSDSNVNTS